MRFHDRRGPARARNAQFRFRAGQRFAQGFEPALKHFFFAEFDEILFALEGLGAACGRVVIAQQHKARGVVAFKREVLKRKLSVWLGFEAKADHGCVPVLPSAPMSHGGDIGQVPPCEMARNLVNAWPQLREKYMKTRLIVASVLVLALGAVWLMPRGAEIQAQAKVEKIANLDEFLKGNEDYQKLDTTAKCDYLANLCDKEKRIDWNQKKWMQFRVLMAQAKTDGIDKDTLKLVQWAGALAKDYKNPLNKSAYYAIDLIVAHYGTKRLYADETFTKGDIKGKLKRVKELWTARELGQSITYALTNDLVFRYLAAAGGKIHEEVKLLGELNKEDVMVWDSTASIQFGVMLRALYEMPELSDNSKRMKWLSEISDSKTGKLSWMMVGDMRASLMMELLGADEEFLKLDYAGRAAKLEQAQKDGYLSSSDVTSLKCAFCATK